MRKCDCIYVTTSFLTKEAKAYQKRMSHKLELWDGSNLEQYVRAFTWKEEIHKVQEETLEKERKILCSKCGSEMVLRKAGKWDHKWEIFMDVVIFQNVEIY